MEGERITHTIGGDWKFGFRAVVPGPAPPRSGEEAEEYLVSQLAAQEERCQELRFDLLDCFRRNGRFVDALVAAKDCLEHARSTEEMCEAYFSLGLMMEQQEDWRSASAWYEAAKRSGTSNDYLMYYIYNNLGYCLNQLGRFEESLPLFRTAVEIDALRANAFKNFGACLEGLGHFVGAARMYIVATRADAADSRALRHLDRLRKRHPEVCDHIRDLDNQISKCREAVTYAARERKRMKRSADDDGNELTNQK